MHVRSAVNGDRLYISADSIPLTAARAYVRALVDHLRSVQATQGPVSSAWIEWPSHRIPLLRRPHRVPTVVLKITNNDGTEDAIGPVDVGKTLASSVLDLLRPAEAKRQEAAVAATVEELKAEQEERSRLASEANQRRIAGEGT
ncbi:MAG: hypothetical protein LC798_05430 [Chloroflexi bacterium]|nr:hypothetical protein [Chloroflexota bacterium]